MGLDLWFRQDVARILASMWQTMHATAQATGPATGPGGSGEGRLDAVGTSDERLARAYRRGFEDALRAVGVAFGLDEGGSGPRRAEYPAEYRVVVPHYTENWGQE